MKRLLSTLIVLSSLPTPAFAAFTIEGHVDTVQQTLGYHLPTKIQDGSIETKVRKNHEADETEAAFKQNMWVLRTPYLGAWLCATKKDVTKCRSSWKD